MFFHLMGLLKIAVTFRVYFDSQSGIVKYYHGQNRNTHTIGTVRNVGLFSGSPFDDHVILYAADMKVVQLRGHNVYEFKCNDLVAAESSEPRQFQIVDKSTSPPKINLHTTSPLEINANDVILQNKMLKVFDTTGESPRPIFEVLVETETAGNLFINNAGSRPINLEYINPVLITGEKINLNYGPDQRFDYKEGDNSDLLFLKWPISQNPKKGYYEINMKGGTDYVVVSDKYFLDPSGIDGESLTLTVRSGATSSEPNPDGHGYKKPITTSIDQPGVPYRKSIFFTTEILFAEKIINEYGDELLNIEEFLKPRSLYPMVFDLHEKYMEVTRKTLKIKSEEDAIE